MAGEIIIRNPNTDYVSIVIGGRLEVESKDTEGEVEFLFDDDSLLCVYLDQSGVKTLIKHLQKQLI